MTDTEAAFLNVRGRMAKRTNERAAREFVVLDTDDTIDRLAGLLSAVQAAEYELTAGVHLARAAGMTWANVGAALGSSPQNASKKYGKADEAQDVPLAERERVGRRIGVAMRVSRFELHRVIRGRRKYTAVETEHLSSHRRMDTALEAAGRLDGARWEIHEVQYDGTDLLRAHGPHTRA